VRRAGPSRLGIADFQPARDTQLGCLHRVCADTGGYERGGGDAVGGGFRDDEETEGCRQCADCAGSGLSSDINHGRAIMIMNGDEDYTPTMFRNNCK
jgi:hypothetical protein